jgi:hypothetical protein
VRGVKGVSGGDTKICTEDAGGAVTGSGNAGGRGIESTGSLMTCANGECGSLSLGDKIDGSSLKVAGRGSRQVADNGRLTSTDSDGIDIDRVG